jgi:hypothetical protein
MTPHLFSMLTDCANRSIVVSRIVMIDVMA